MIISINEEINAQSESFKNQKLCLLPRKGFVFEEHGVEKNRKYFFF